MDKRRQGYEAFIAQLKKQWEETEAFQGERLNRMIAKVQAYLEAAGDLTQDELALIAVLALKDTAWSWLADVTDRTQVEWQELADELEHKGVYRAGDWVGLGVLVCDHCEWRHTVLHPEQLGTCPECGADEYHREPLSP